MLLVGVVVSEGWHGSEDLLLGLYLCVTDIFLKRLYVNNRYTKPTITIVIIVHNINLKIL